MKGSRWFVIGIVAFLVIMFAVEYHLPKKFVWTPTYSHYDEQPFGCAVFDSVLSSSLPSGYALSKKSLYQLEQEDSTQNKGVLIIANSLSLHQTDVEALLKMADRGDKIMLASTHFGYLLEDTLRFTCSYSYFNAMSLRKYASSLGMKKDTIYWTEDSVYPNKYYCYYPQLCASHFLRCDSLPMKVLAEKNFLSKATYEITDKDTAKIYRAYHPLVAFSRPWGKGEVILVSTPLLFTNYGMLDGNNANYLFRLLSQMGELPIVRTEGYMKETAQKQLSPFRYFLSQPPLRWGLYLTVITILLFMVFTARRKQRAIPIVRQPENKSLEFIKLIGTLYSQKKNHSDLVRKKFIYFAEELRREIQVDIEDEANDERTIRRVVRKTGMDTEEISRFVHEIRPIINEKKTVTDTEMKYCINKMNKIINHI